MEGRFSYKKDTLYCENVSVPSLIKKHGTPLYVYSENSLVERFNNLQKAFSKIEPLICFSTKACSNLAILKLLVNAGAGLAASTVSWNRCNG